jgi:hypothetical protein
MRRYALALMALLPLLGIAQAGANPAPEGCPACPVEFHTTPPATFFAPDVPLDAYFEDEVWAKVGERTCLNCHSAGGDAEESKFILRPENLKANRLAFDRMAHNRKDGKPLLLLKASGGLDHGGGVAVKPGSTGYLILEHYMKSLETPSAAGKGVLAPTPFFQGLEMASPDRLYRKLTLSLAGRLPGPEERAAIERQGLAAIDGLLDSLLKEEAFYDRLKEGFNDIFLTLGYDGNAEDALAYDHFEKVRHWAEKYSLDHIPEKDRQKARYKLWDDYRKALKTEPLELIKYIVANDRPFTEIVTADYFMASPYSARGYGIYEEVEERFTNPDDPFEYIPVSIPALKGRDGKVQKTAAGIYPHAGILSQFQYLRRYPTTITNRNRLRARMYYRHFLGIDVMALAPRVTDAAAVAKKFSNPTMQAPDCVVCHRTIDPVAGLFQDYFNEEGHYGPRKEGWFTDMYGPGLEGVTLPADDKWRSLQWLGEKTAKDPRFAVAMTEHVYYILFGRKVLQTPQDIDAPHFTQSRRAFQVQRREIRDIADRFVKSGYNLKTVFKAWAASPFYRVEGAGKGALDPARKAELDDIGVTRMLTPEGLERKVLAIFGRPWGRLDSEEYRILYGGIDSKAVTERALDPSGAMGAIQRIMSNDVACKNVAYDFSRPAAERKLFPGIEIDVVPGTPEDDVKIRKTIGHLHDYLLGREVDVERTYKLFKAIYDEATSKKGMSKQESYFCGAVREKRVEDPHYTVRAWRAVVTYLLRQDDFLYE